MIMKYGGAPKWKESNFCSITEKLKLDMRNIRTPRPKHEPNRIIRRGKRMLNGDTLWVDCATGILSIEKANSNVAQ